MRTATTVLLSVLLSTPVIAGDDTSQASLVSAATGGRLTALKGKYYDQTCQEELEYEAEVVDLNGDGQPEVFTSIAGTCLGGMTGTLIDLYIMDQKGRWAFQFDFPGMYTVLSPKNLGFPPI